jgi:hypothetical protein
LPPTSRELLAWRQTLQEQSVDPLPMLGYATKFKLSIVNCASLGEGGLLPNTFCRTRCHKIRSAYVLGM